MGSGILTFERCRRIMRHTTYNLSETTGQGIDPRTVFAYNLSSKARLVGRRSVVGGTSTLVALSKAGFHVHPEHKALRTNYIPILTALVVRDGYRCARCGGVRYIRIDHIVPVRRGGITELDNLQLLCHRCNGIKGNQIADYRPANRGQLGYERPRYTSEGALIIRIVQYRRSTRPEIIEAELVECKRSSVYVWVLGDDRTRRFDLEDIYPPDLQHLFKA